MSVFFLVELSILTVSLIVCFYTVFLVFVSRLFFVPRLFFSVCNALLLLLLPIIFPPFFFVFFSSRSFSSVCPAPLLLVTRIRDSTEQYNTKLVQQNGGMQMARPVPHAPIPESGQGGGKLKKTGGVNDVGKSVPHMSAALQVGQ